jgi:acyl carrier protein
VVADIEGSSADRVRRIIIRQLEVDADKVVGSAHFSDDLGADSLEVVQIVMEIEEEFGIEIPDNAADTIETVDDAIAFVLKAQSEL